MTKGTSPFLTQLAHQLPPALEQIEVPSYILDSTGHIRWLNDAAKEVVGDCTGKLFTSVIEAGDVPAARDRFHRNLRGEKHGEFGLDVRAADGTTQRIDVSSVPLTDGHRAVGMFGIMRRRRKGEKGAPVIDGRLTARQHEILRHLANGKSTQQIAELLHLSRETVRNHVRNILARLGASSRLEAVAIAHNDELV